MMRGLGYQSHHFAPGTSGATLNFNFLNDGLDPRITFTRASTATYFNSAGVLTSAANDTPRFDYNPATLAAQGLLIEEARTNRIANAISTGAMTIGTGTAIGPDGQPMRAAIVNSGPVSFPQIGIGGSNSQSFTLSAGQTIDVALSGWFAAGVSGMAIEPMLIAEFRTAPSINPIYALLQINTSNWTVRAKTLPADTTEVSAPSITQFSPGVYRVTWVVRYTQGATIRDVSAVYVQLRDSTGSGTFTGDGIGNFQYFGLQGETGSFPTSYIPTTTTALTRNADQASVNTLSPWFNATAGTIFCQGLTPPGLANFPAIGPALSDGTTSNRMIQYVFTNGFYGAATTSGASQGNTSITTTPTIGAQYKFATAYSNNDSQSALNGTASTVDNTYTVPTVNQMQINTGGAASVNLPNSWIQRITYYPRRLSQAELTAITA